MGLDTSHDCWHGPYSAFGRFRASVFAAAFGAPPGAESNYYAYLNEVDRWAPDDARRKDPIVKLLMHSDCDGEIGVDDQLSIAERLETLAKDMTSDNATDALQFAKGLREAHAAGEPVDFH